MTKDKKILLGYISVDSGQILITDPCYLKNEWQDNEMPTNGEDLPKYKEEYSYAGCCHATLQTKQAGILKFKNKINGAGAAIQTYDGDGSYPVYIVKDKTGVKKIIINFRFNE